MMKHSPLTADTFREWVEGESELDVARISYCYQLGSTFAHLAGMEDSIISVMAMCDRIKVASALGEDAEAWKRLLEKNDRLKSSTLGSLITILSKHSILPADLAYLKWVKEKRDFFVHRFFHEGQWPGNLNEYGVEIMRRRLLYLEIIFARASAQISKILANAGLIARIDLGADGAVLMNLDYFQGEDGL